MKIGLIDVDGHNFPNLALMKISTFYKAIGCDVEWYDGISHYDKVLMSKVFTFTPDFPYPVNATKIIKGGTGYDCETKMPPSWESRVPDYSIYPIGRRREANTSYGFITRGCIHKCSWCIVPKKEGAIAFSADINYILQGRKRAILLDNNILASDFGLRQIEKIIGVKCKVDFNQGLDARLVTDDIAKLLSKVKWIKYIRFALDTQSQLDPLMSAVEKLNKYGVKNSKLFVYCLIRDLNDSLNRINKVKTLGMNPFAQPYRDFTPYQIIPQWQHDMARWCNDKAIMKSCDFKDYIPRKGFKCDYYFKNETI